MRTAQAICAGILLLSLEVRAQKIDTSTTQGLLQHIFQNIDKSQVPTGFLEEYGCPMLPMATFNGTLTDSNLIDMNLWRTLYFQLQTGYCGAGTNPLPAITAVNAAIRQSSYDSLPVPIPILIGQYNTVKSHAFTANLLSYNSATRQIQDVAGRTESPYQANHLFAACPNEQVTTTGQVTFTCQSGLVWNNTGKTISQIQIDFDNAAGFQNVPMGSPITVSYTDTGSKRWKIKITLSDNTVLQCYNQYYVLKVADDDPSARYQTNVWDELWNVPDTLSHSGGRVFISYSSLGRTNTLRKPLIVVEGFDVWRVAPTLDPDNYEYSDIVEAIDAPFLSFDFNGRLDSIAGYDLVFVDFNEGTDDIRRNAALIEEVIGRVNGNKVLDDRFGNIRQQNVVMGLSMGGLVARYALARMTKNGTPTETRLLISHDSPHRGANVPLGMQYLIRMMGGVQLFGFNVSDIFPEYEEAIELLNEPATGQMLLYRAITANTFAANTFLNGEYRNMITFSATDSLPSYRFIATSLGSECGHQLFNPGTTFVNLGAGVSAGLDGRVLFFRVPIVSYKLAAEVEAYALPSAGSQSKIARLYTINNLKLFGFIDIFKQLYNNTAYAPGNHLPVDGVPGSISPLLDVPVLDELAGLPVFNPISLTVNLPLGPLLGGYFGIYAYNAGASFSFTFVPVGSALDVSPYNVNTFSQQFVNGTNQNFPSSGETFIAQETNTAAGTTNNEHILFTARNSEWLFREMEAQPNYLNCSNECYNPYYISGNNSFCTSGTYSIPGLPRGATVTWSVFPRGIVTLSCLSCNQVTLTKQTSGRFTLTATVSNACGASPISIPKSLVAGPPPITIWGPFDPVEHAVVGVACVGQQYYFEAGDTETGQTYSWTLYPPPGSLENPTLYSGFRVYTTFGEMGEYTLRVSKTNSCGTTSTDRIINVQECLSGFSVLASPNPAQEDVYVTTEQESKEVQLLGKNEEVTIALQDVYTNRVQRMWSFKNDQSSYRINVGGLPKGVYVLVVTKGKYQSSRQLLVQ